MKSEPIVPAWIEITADGLPYSPQFGDIYHPRIGAEAQARHVFLGGNGLPGRWQGRDGFTIVETGFGLGHNFLATWDAWRRDPARCARLCFVSVERHPPTREALSTLHCDAPLAAQLVEAWPPATMTLHRRVFEAGRVELLLAFGDGAAWLRELELKADAFFLDGFAPPRNRELWDERLCKSLARLAAPEATLATWTAAHAVRRHLVTAGFDVRLEPGIGGKREITTARFRPVHVAARSARREASVPGDRIALIVGGGLAGAATAAALAERGWESRLYDRAEGLAAGASGNPAGLFHATVHADDGLHARFARAGAFAVAPAVAEAIARHGVAGASSGFLRLEQRATLAEMQALLARSGLPPDHLQAVDAETASALAGFAVDVPAWVDPRGGWVDPAGLVRAWVEQAGATLQIRTGTHVAAIRRAGPRWALIDADGVTIDAAETLVLACAGDALRLLGNPDWPVGTVRGQIALLATAAVPPRLVAVRRPVAGNGYLIPTPGGLVFGATRQPDDHDPSVRADDHRQNLARLEALVGAPLGIDPGAVAGRTAWRVTARDRLPLIGPVPALDILQGARAREPRWDQPRHVPREPGLHLFAALGSRGIATSALGAQVVAAGIARTPVPLEASLLDAIDPARFVSRAVRAGHAPVPRPA